MPGSRRQRRSSPRSRSRRQRVVPSLPASIILFGVVGFAFGPVYPLIMAVAGDRFPGRAAAVSGFLAGVAVLGAIVYPPVMGFLSVAVGLGVAMVGAAILAFICAVMLFSLGLHRSREAAVLIVRVVRSSTSGRRDIVMRPSDDATLVGDRRACIRPLS